MTNAAIEVKQFLVSCREAMGHKFDPPVIATIDDLRDADIQRAAMIVAKLGDEVA